MVLFHFGFDPIEGCEKECLQEKLQWLHATVSSGIALSISHSLVMSMFFLLGLAPEMDHDWDIHTIQSDTTLPQYEPKDPELPEYTETAEASSIPLQEISVTTTAVEDEEAPSNREVEPVESISVSANEQSTLSTIPEVTPIENQIEQLSVSVRSL
jgi:hypothetical protein